MIPRRRRTGQPIDPTGHFLHTSRRTVLVKTLRMKRYWTAFLLAAGVLPPSAYAGPQYSAEEIIEHFTRTPAPGAAGADAADVGGRSTTRGVFIGAAGFGSEAGAAAAATQGGAAPTGTAPTGTAQAGTADSPLAIPMTGAKAGQGTSPLAEAGQPGAPVVTNPASYDLLITFELDSARLTPQARENLDAFVAALRSRALQPYRFLVEGHTDATGPEGYNQRLSERRAASVVDYLVANGIESSRVVSRGFGETRPRLADPDHPENRRVETRRFQ
jgi:outer membrane protein OmpA-like peptidoglycan-associated protein